VTNSPGEWPALETYIAGPEILGFAFDYPAHFLDCISWGDRDIDAGGDGHALTFLDRESVRTDLQSFVRKATSSSAWCPSLGETTATPCSASAALATQPST